MVSENYGLFRRLWVSSEPNRKKNPTSQPTNTPKKLQNKQKDLNKVKSVKRKE